MSLIKFKRCSETITDWLRFESKLKEQNKIYLMNADGPSVMALQTALLADESTTGY